MFDYVSGHCTNTGSDAKVKSVEFTCEKEKDHEDRSALFPRF